MCEAEWGTKAGEPGVSPSFNPPGCGVGCGTAHATGCRTVTQGWGEGETQLCEAGKGSDQVLPTLCPRAPRE